ncbi:MAG: hypothetical protein AAF726_20265 [Planctomycetota bacterium]
MLTSRTVLALVALLGGIVSYFTFSEFLFEDSYITLRYATNIAAGNGFVFQTGESILGTSAPLWAMLLALPLMVGADPEVVLDVSFCASLVALSYAGGRLLDRLGAPRAGIAFAVLVPLGVGRLQAYWGMETPLFIALLFGSWCLALDRRYVTSGLLLGLACVTRYEGYAFAVAMALCMAGQRNWDAVRAGGAAVAAVTLPWLAFAWFTFGSLIPLPAPSKARHCSPFRYFERSLLDLPSDLFWPWASLGYPYVIGLLIGVLTGVFGLVGVIRLFRSREMTALALPLGALFVFAVLVATRPGPLCTWHRVPLHLIGVLFALYGLSTLLKSARWNRLGIAAAVTTLLVAIPVHLEASAKLRNTFQYVGREIAYPEIADFLRTTGLNQTTLVTWEPGYLAFMSDVRVIDVAGLVTPLPEFDATKHQRWDSGFPPEADLVLLRAPFRPEGFELLFEGSMGAWLFARPAVAESYAEAIEAYRASDGPRGRPLSEGSVILRPSYEGPPFIFGTPTRLDREQGSLALTAETPLLWIDRPAIEVEFQTSTPGLVQLQLVVRGEVVLATSDQHDRESRSVRWDVGPWLDRNAKVRMLALAGSGADASFGRVSLSAD